MINYTTEHKTGAYNPFQGLQWRITCSRLGNYEVCNYEHNGHVQTLDRVNEYMPLVDYVNEYMPLVDHVNGYMLIVDRVYYPTTRTMVNHHARGRACYALVP